MDGGYRSYRLNKKGKIVAENNMENQLAMFKNMTYEIVLNESLTEERKNSLMGLDYEFYIMNNGSKLI